MLFLPQLDSVIFENTGLSSYFVILFCYVLFLFTQFFFFYSGILCILGFSMIFIMSILNLLSFLFVLV